MVVNFFELLKVPVNFEIDNEMLSAHFRELQQRYHPDVAGVAPEQALQKSAEINLAFDTLRAPDTRAGYLLRLRKQDAGLQHSISDLEFLHTALELREQLDESATPIELQGLQLELRQWLEALGRQFILDFEDEDWVEARDTARKLAFMQNVLMDVEQKMDRLEDQEDDSLWDDD